MGRFSKGEAALAGSSGVAAFMLQQQNSPNAGTSLILLASIVAAVFDWRYKRRGGKQPTTKDRLFFTVAVFMCAALVAYFAFRGTRAYTLGSLSQFLLVILFGLWEFARWRVRAKHPLLRRPPAPAPVYLDLGTLRQDIIANSPDPEEREKSIEPLFRELKQKFGDRIPADQLQQFISTEQQTLKTQMQAYVDRATAREKTISVEEIRQALEKAKAAYKGNDVEAFNRANDDLVASLRAQYGEQIPVAEAVKVLQKLERAAGQTDSAF